MWHVIRLPSGTFTLEHDNGQRYGLFWSRDDAKRARQRMRKRGK